MSVSMHGLHGVVSVWRSAAAAAAAAALSLPLTTTTTTNTHTQQATTKQRRSNGDDEGKLVSLQRQQQMKRRRAKEVSVCLPVCLSASMAWSSSSSVATMQSVFKRRHTLTPCWLLFCFFVLNDFTFFFVDSEIFSNWIFSERLRHTPQWRRFRVGN